MADETIRDAASFIWALKQSTDCQFDVDAIEWMEQQEQRIFGALDARGVKGLNRDRVILYEGMRRGVMLKLRRRVLETRTALQDANMLNPDGTVKEPKREN